MKMALCLICLFLSLGVKAEVIKVKIKGMVCSFCSMGLIKRAENNPKVEKVAISLLDNEMQIISKKESLSNLEVEAIVKEAGFAVISIERSSP